MHCDDCRKFRIHLTRAQGDLGRAARKCARNDTPANRRAVTSAKDARDYAARYLADHQGTHERVTVAA